MTANTARRLRTAIIIMMVCIPVSLTYEFIESVIDVEIEGKISFVGAPGFRESVPGSEGASCRPPISWHA